MQWNTKHLLSYFLFFNLTICSFSYELIIKYKPLSSVTGKSASDKNLRVNQLKDSNPSIMSVRSFKYAPSSYQIIQVSEDEKDNLLESLNANPDIEYAHPNYQAKLLYTPNDTYYATDSYYRGLFTEYGAQTAWDITTGSTQVIVAILDTGIDTDHVDFVGRCLTQDWYDFGNNDSNPEDFDGHGTHVSGIIGANGDNGLGVTGMNWKCKILPIKVFSDAGAGNSSQIIEAIYYAVNKGAKVINMSLAFYDSFGNPVYFTGALQEAIDYAYSHGVCIVAAGGNEDLDISTYKLSPVCNDGNSNKIFGVSALTGSKTKASFSNYSSQFIDISSFGVNIWSSIPNNNYQQKDGTSMATPAVSGIISLLLSLSPNLSPTQVMDYLRSSAENIDALNASYIGKLGAGFIKADDLLSLYQGTQTSTKNTDEVLQFYNYPNPVESSAIADNSTTFYAEFTKPISNASIGIYSITGRKVHEINISQSSSTVLYQSWNLGNGINVLPSGVYIAVLKANISGKELVKYQKVLIK